MWEYRAVADDRGNFKVVEVEFDTSLKLTGGFKHVDGVSSKDIDTFSDIMDGIAAARYKPVLHLVDGKVYKVRPQTFKDKVKQVSEGLARALFEARMSAGMTAHEASDKVGWHVSCIEEFEDPSLEKFDGLIKYLHALGADLEIKIIIPGQDDMTISTKRGR